MSKKMMVLGLIVASMAMFALPAVASAQEMEIDPGAGTKFTGHAPEGKLTAEGEPQITCETTDVSGEFTSTKTGSMALDFTGCHINFLGATVKCRSAGSALDNTISTGGIFHAITFSNKPAVLVTVNPTTVLCATQKIEVTGNVIGTVTSPACNVESATAVIAFSAEKAIQNDKLYTGTNYNLKATTEGGAGVEAGLDTTATLTATGALMKMTCQ